MGWLGTLSFQANDNTDVFLTAEVAIMESISPDEALLGINTDDLDTMPEFITGRVPKATPVRVDGDTTSLHCLFRAQQAQSFTLTMYVEYEETEESSKEEQVQ
jgi:hypothetical protein